MPRVEREPQRLRGLTRFEQPGGGKAADLVRLRWGLVARREDELPHEGVQGDQPSPSA